MPDFFTTGVERTRSHYPDHLRTAQAPPYLSALSATAQTAKHPVTFDYLIAASFNRQHYNPPFWLDEHPHDFQVQLHLQAICRPEDLYGLDMVETQKGLQAWCDRLPERINDSPQCPLGTTEQLCLYFAQIPLHEHIKIVSVSVSETPERITKLCLEP